MGHENLSWVMDTDSLILTEKHKSGSLKNIAAMPSEKRVFQTAWRRGINLFLMKQISGLSVWKV
ncbi:hypothetical protein [Bergeriella denitrificans]|uniref:hypothetical protein n=1 Tax=Bergeriella denitrificans TaxID=494 RepID=UPI0011C08370|nr:hypothetical protein [Bergeriella denitrificans]